MFKLCLLKITLCCWYFVSVFFCCLVGRYLLKAAAYVLVVLHWLFLLFSSLFSYLFGWLNFTDEFRDFFLVSVHHTWLGDIWIVTCWFLFTLLYSVKAKSDWSFELIYFISCSVFFIVVSQNFIAIFTSCFEHSSCILYYWLTNSSFPFPTVGLRLVFKPFGVRLS